MKQHQTLTELLYPKGEPSNPLVPIKLKSCCQARTGNFHISGGLLGNDQMRASANLVLLKRNHLSLELGPDIMMTVRDGECGALYGGEWNDGVL